MFGGDDEKKKSYTNLPLPGYPMQPGPYEAGTTIPVAGEPIEESDDEYWQRLLEELYMRMKAREGTKPLPVGSFSF